MLNIQNLSVHVQGQSILKKINLEVRPQEIHVILGPNGAGKSTLGQVLLGNSKFSISEGNITFYNENLLALEPYERARKGFFLSFQSPPEVEGISLKELLFGAKKSMDPDFYSSFRFKKTILENLKKVNLSEDFLDRDVNKNASGGEKKKLEMVALMTLNPQLAFLDEIDSGVDIDALQAITQSINQYMLQPQKSLIIVSHTEKFLQLIRPTHVHILIQGCIIKSGGSELIEEIHRIGFKNLPPLIHS